MTQAANRLQNQLVAALQTTLRTGKPVHLPEAGRLLWQIFGELSSTRTYHMAGPNPIAYSEIVAWQRLFDWKLERHHLDLILAMDRAFLEHASARREKAPDGVKALPPSSGQAVNAAAFDAVFG